jgi:hypothetical protein
LTGENFMHVVIATLYGFIIFLSVLAYCVIASGPVGLVLAFGPLIISGAVAVILTLDLALMGLVWAWRNVRAVRTN